jgi:hypothetical protein
MAVTVSRNGRFQFNPASATRRNFPNRVMTATSAVLTVKKLPRTVPSSRITMIVSGTRIKRLSIFASLTKHP